MLTELLLKNYRCHAETRIPLGRLNVLVGPNAIGKSSALEALWVLGRLLDRPESKLLLVSEPRLEGNVLTGAKDLLWLARRGGGELAVRVKGENEGEMWELWARSRNHNIVLEWEGGLSDEHDKDELSLLFKRGQYSFVLQSADTFRFDSRRLAEPSHLTEEEPRLQEDGYGLATVLSALKLMSTERFFGLGGRRTRHRAVPPQDSFQADQDRAKSATSDYRRSTARDDP